MIELNVGSVLNSTPEQTVIKNSKIVMRWKIPVSQLDGTTENVYITREKIIDGYLRTLMWIDIYKHIFPVEIIDDAKRVAYDLNQMGFIEASNIKQQSLALVCLNISCSFHKFDFHSKKDEIFEAKHIGAEVFGIKLNKITYNMHFNKLNKYTDMAIQLLPDDKFNILMRMHQKVGEMDGREMDNVCRNQ